MACSKLEARGHLPHKTGTPPKHFSRECICILKRSLNFAKSPSFFWLVLHRTKVRRRFRKILWPSQNIWTLKIWHPAFWKTGTLFFEKKQSAKNQGHCNSKREEAAWSLLFLNIEWTCFFQPAFCKKQGAPFFKKQGARFLIIVGADWLGE